MGRVVLSGSVVDLAAVTSVEPVVVGLRDSAVVVLGSVVPTAVVLLAAEVLAVTLVTCRIGVSVCGKPLLQEWE